MATSLVIVESSSKAKTLFKTLGGIYQVFTSVDDFEDLPKNTRGNDIEHDFDDSVAHDRFIKYATGVHVGLI